jgi:hypothetical protein
MDRFKKRHGMWESSMWVNGFSAVGLTEPSYQRTAYMEIVLTFGPDIFDSIPDHFQIRDSLTEGRRIIPKFN